VQLDDAYLGDEPPGVGGRGSPNKVPILAVVSTGDARRPMWVKLNAISGFTTQAVTDWTRDQPQITKVNTGLGNLKSMISGAHKPFKFTKYAGTVPRRVLPPLQPALQPAAARQ
jgi:hypothetical protein